MAIQNTPRSFEPRMIILAILLLQPRIRAQSSLYNCFGDYGQCSQQVILPLYEATGCLCSSPGTCACSNSTYLFSVMAGVGACCTLSELNNTAQTSIDNCEHDGTPSIVDFAELVDAGKAATINACTIAGLATIKPSSTTSRQAQVTLSSISASVSTATETKGNLVSSSSSESIFGTYSSHQ